MIIEITERESAWQTSLVGVRHRLLNHALYTQVNSLERVRVFMEHHVFAVWDFMSLLKRLQQVVTCVQVPWLPSTHPELVRFVNEIVLGEESDEDGRGGYSSHFDLYLQAMDECGANTTPIQSFIKLLTLGIDPAIALQSVETPAWVRCFVLKNIELARHGAPHEVAAAFFFGREDIIPEIFSRLTVSLKEQGHRVDRLVYYMERHIEVDGDHHGPLAKKLLTQLCIGNPERWTEAAETASLALESRIGLWDGMLQALRRV